MHLGNGAVTPECAALGFAVAGLGVGWSLWNASKAPRSHSLLEVAALGSLVFAAQMINIPVLQSSSAHFVGGVLLAELLGPAIGLLTMAAVLLLQAFLLGDGGVAALGVNIVNMAVLPAGLVALLHRYAPNRRSSAALAGVSALAIALAVLFIAAEVAWGRSTAEMAQWSSFRNALAVAHLPALVLEAGMTLAAIAGWNYLNRTEASSKTEPRFKAIGVIAAALLLIATAGFVSSDLPDGYERSASVAQMTWLLEE